MRLNSLALQNFRQHRKTVVEFDSGLTGIIGPNGAGKSTILEAIAWALYGNPAARGTRDGIRWQRAEHRSPVSVELDFDLGGHRYRIVRGLTTAEVYLDGGSSPIADSISAVAELVHRLFRMSLSEFYSTYFTGQKELSVMSAMKPTERAQFLSRVLGYERLRSAQELVRERRRTIVAEVNGLRAAMRDPVAVEHNVREAERGCLDATKRFDEAENFRVDAEHNLAELTPRWEKAQQERDRLQEVLAELRVTESQEGALSRDAERIMRELRETETAREELGKLKGQLATLDAVQEEFQRLETLARHDGRRRALQESVRGIEEEMVRLRERYGKVEGAPALEEEVTVALEEARKELQEMEGILEARRTEWVRDKQEAETRRHALRLQYAEHKGQREKLVALGDEGDCPTCMRPLRESFRGVLELLDSQLETLVVDGNYFKSRVEQLEHMPEDIRLLDDRRRNVFGNVGNLERRLANVQNNVREKQQLSREMGVWDQRRISQSEEIASIPAGYDQSKHDEVRAEVDRLAPMESTAARLGALLEKEPQLLEERARVAEAIGAASSRLAELRDKRQAFASLEKEYGTLRTAHEFAAVTLHQSEVAAATAQSELAAARQQLDAALREKENLRAVEEQVRLLNVQRRMHDELDRTFSDLRTDLNFQLRPELSDLASSFLSDLTDGRFGELELDDSYRIVVLENDVPKPVISGGEEDLANLSLRLAISQMIAERSGQSLSLLVLDEVFGSLDEDRRLGVVELLRRVRDRFEQIILITHVESVREGLDREIAISIDPQSGSSVLESRSEADLFLVGGARDKGRRDKYLEISPAAGNTGEVSV